MTEERGAGGHTPSVDPKGRGGSVSGTEFAGIGVQFALTILVFVAAGVWLDRKLGSSPWLLLISVFLGAAGGVYSMYRRVTASQQRQMHDSNRGTGRRGTP